MISGRVYVYVYVYTRSSCRRNRLRKSRKSSRSRRGFSEKLFFSFSNGNSHPFPRVDIYMRYACARARAIPCILRHMTVRHDFGIETLVKVIGSRWRGGDEKFASDRNFFFLNHKAVATEKRWYFIIPLF